MKDKKSVEPTNLKIFYSNAFPSCKLKTEAMTLDLHKYCLKTEDKKKIQLDVTREIEGEGCLIIKVLHFERKRVAIFSKFLYLMTNILHFYCSKAVRITGRLVPYSAFFRAVLFFYPCTQ